MTAEFILENPWSYQLFKTENGYVLSVPFGGSAISEINIGISNEEAQAGINDHARLDSLAAGIRQNPRAFAEFEVAFEK